MYSSSAVISSRARGGGAARCEVAGGIEGGRIVVAGVERLPDPLRRRRGERARPQHGTELGAERQQQDQQAGSEPGPRAGMADVAEERAEGGGHGETVYELKWPGLTPSGRSK